MKNQRASVCVPGDNLEDETAQPGQRWRNREKSLEDRQFGRTRGTQRAVDRIDVKIQIMSQIDLKRAIYIVYE